MVVEAIMTPEQFEEGIEGWRQEVASEYPYEEPLTEWLLNMKEKDGIPLLDTMEPELKITHRFSKKRKAEGFDWSIRCPSGTLIMNMHSRPGSDRQYANLKDEFERWFPKWVRHFNISQCHAVTLIYVNSLSRDVTPDLFTSEGDLELGKALTVFAGIPGVHERLEPPFDCQVTVRLNPETSLHIRVNDDSSLGRGPTVLVKLKCTAALRPGHGTVQEALQLLNWCHERIIERFELVFTTEAKETFGPTRHP